MKYIPNVDGNSFRSPRKPHIVEARTKARNTELTITCDTCSARLYSVRAHVYRGAPETHFTMAAQAMTSHQRATGCAGHLLDPKRLESAVQAAIVPEGARLAPEAIDKLVGKEVDDLTAALGIPREKAAQMVAEAVEALRTGRSREQVAEALREQAGSFETLAAGTFNGPADAGAGPWDKLANMSPADQRALHVKQMQAAIAEGERRIKDGQ